MIEFDDLELPLAQLALGEAPGPEVKARLLAKIRGERSDVPQGFSFKLEAETESEWQSHLVPGIRFKVLAFNPACRYVTVLFDVEPGVTFPPHHHSGAEECFVVSGTVRACGRTIGPGDFHHADGETDHGELHTDTGCRLLLVVPPDDYIPGYVPPAA